jgi:hypothetical protein
VDDDGTTLSGCGGGDQYYYSWGGTEEPSPSPIRYARPEEVGWADDDDDGSSEGAVGGCSDEGEEEVVDISLRTEERKRTRRKSHPGDFDYHDDLTPVLILANGVRPVFTHGVRPLFTHGVRPLSLTHGVRPAFTHGLCAPVTC